LAEKNKESVNATEAGLSKKASALEEATPVLDLPIIEVELEIKKGLSRVADPAIGMIKKNIITKNLHNLMDKPFC